MLFNGASGAFGLFGGVTGALGALRGLGLIATSISPRPSVDVLQKGHFVGSCPAIRLIFFPQFEQITGGSSASAGLKHTISPLVFSAKLEVTYGSRNASGNSLCIGLKIRL